MLDFLGSVPTVVLVSFPLSPSELRQLTLRFLFDLRHRLEVVVIRVGVSEEHALRQLCDGNIGGVVQMMITLLQRFSSDEAKFNDRKVFFSPPSLRFT